MEELLYGRILSEKELQSIPENVQRLESMSENGQYIICHRCNSKNLKEEVKLQIDAYYCSECINLGRVRSDEYLYHLPQKSFPKREESVLKWSGKLTELQGNISKSLIEANKDKDSIWVHAVTGAGKTEMIYQVVAETVNNGGAVGIASPRVDVCIELHKRMVNDFDIDIALLYAEGDSYYRTQLMILTTHQLLRFKEAFDLLIIDEVDAFPFADNAMLYYAAENSRKDESCLIYLTATATKNLNNQVYKGSLKKVNLPRRFHGSPLVVPQNIWCNIPWEVEKIPQKLFSYIQEQRKTGFPLLIFAPVISFGHKFEKTLQKFFPNEKIACVSSISENRKDLVNDFREEKIDILITTTILERGVTFPRVDVFVLHANHKLFSSSSLVQISGRVGRSPDRTDGLVYFFHNGKSKGMVDAISEIKDMNRLGGF
ncbi:DNA/RNA helicase [Floricoccus penangensis]|uniref:DNA/RNA helicase n=1 Tax=Floricoccus penangensis TaxID=1859475 RepID=A0A9Q5NZA5_9LACT|nr:DEAD/DEAH box helicase [Floricoccus penangensis]OFI46414.1 DNA/RNA helicase [Floricoccus penangensis]